ncbi:hypothetical protein [Salinimicrobium sp. WS361]|uniref:hypothetical protein n=1 Tax=Salinimicrobium sp. WS361 TaxID=3425123 RepID=UPI003D6E3A8A
MTLDYLKIFVKDKELIDKFNSDPALIWSDYREGLSHIKEEAQEGIIKAKTSKVHRGIVFCFHDHGLVIYFKPHYFYNDNKHNANDFTVRDCISVLQTFISTFELVDSDLLKLKIVNLEFGINILSPIKIEDLITFFAYHGRNEFKTDTGLLYSKKSYSLSKKGKASKYLSIKAYAKGIQFPKYADRNMLRFEIKSQESKKINSLGIYTLMDLLRPETYSKLAENLLKEFDDVLILDSSVNLSGLDNNSRLKLVERLNTHFWYKQLQKSKNTFTNSKKTYLRLLDMTGYNIHEDLKNIIKQKFSELQNCAISETPTEEENCAYSNIYIIRNGTIGESTATRRCVVTGNNIPLLKEGAFLFSENEQEDLRQLPEEKAQEMATLIMEIYTIELVKSKMNNREFIEPDRHRGVNYYLGEDFNKLLKQTFSEVETIFEPYYSKWNLQYDCTEVNYFGVTAGFAIGWQKKTVLERFTDTFYLSQKKDQPGEARRRKKLLPLTYLRY